MVISINFDGTCVKDKYPETGENCPGVELVLKRITLNGHQLILDTVRSGELLENAEQWFSENRIPLWGVQKNPDQDWTDSTKVSADLYINNKSLGAILTADFVDGQIIGKPFIDWEKVDNFIHKVYGI
tara:strand:+ start:3963 stop:4346 length:384 start_codon:yes stop_codon:yes gene_type:complete